MGARGAMDMRAAIERDANAGLTDPGGQPLPPNFQPHLSAVACRMWFLQRRFGSEITEDGLKTVITEDRRMIVPVDTDIAEDDRVTQVTDRLGAVLFTGPARIESVGRRHDHLALTIKEIT